MTHDKSAEPAGPEAPAKPAEQATPEATAKPAEQAKPIEAFEVIEVIERLELAALIERIEQPAATEPAEQDEFATLFDDPRQTRAELAALRAANHELVRINERLADTVEQRTADMLAARDAQTRFIADVNRQVRGPLDAIIGYSELLTEDLTSLELHDLAHDVEKIRSAGESLLDLLGQMVERRRLDGG